MNILTIVELGLVLPMASVNHTPDQIMLTFSYSDPKESIYLSIQVRNMLRIVLTMAFNQSCEVPWSPMEELYFIRFIRMSKQPEPLKGRRSGGCHFLGDHIPWISDSKDEQRSTLRFL